ncbi:DNA polymerase III subunit epsilon [Eoetvoesiella caeni]|uniref:DNA polymerase III subunit epsilon n=1 Tax=Eoetvoesiella caeni TaxID=645616 RepID=A0A366HDM5_9BURK|nr:DNA polymerase III subunit epsilon [Eoetvoesiella caeni]MCI2809078.1 DNA polymerase III subunit epsilon [Eoetvoesiella caeni]NYT55421.1 DNA polymerase III subunit epsilon [Eoetvoesiella caeni]RBP39976.1 DNA polymerase III epsilon subunit [Eoetvoesiella caeni]
MRQIILDTETTGLDPSQGHRMVEVACVEMLNRGLTGRHLHMYLNPDRDSDPEALAIHGLTTKFLSEHPRFEDVADEFIDYVKGAEVIIHNAAFDKKFLNAELKRAGKPSFDSLCGKITDSLLFARELHPGKRNSLDALCERYGISNAHRTLHGALLDSELLAEVWLAMTRGQDALIMDFEEGGASSGLNGLGSQAFDATRLRVLLATAEELQAHEEYLDGLDKAAGQPCLWRAQAAADA